MQLSFEPVQDQSGGVPVRMRGQWRVLASFLTQHTPATRSLRPLIICSGTPDSRIAFACLLDSLQCKPPTLSWTLTEQLPPAGARGQPGWAGHQGDPRLLGRTVRPLASQKSVS